MKHISDKQAGELRTAFVKNLEVDFFEPDEIEGVLASIDSFEQPVRQKVQALCFALSNASSSLVPRVLSRISSASQYLRQEDLDEWVAAGFDLLDSTGLDHALAFLGKNSEQELAAFAAPEGVPFHEVAAMLETLLAGLSRLDLKVTSDHDLFTDTVTVHFPSLVNRFPERERNVLLYKLSAAYAWAQIARRTLTLDGGLGLITSRFNDYSLDHPDIDALFSQFPERDLAIDLYAIIEAFRLEPFLQGELPGLMRQAGAILPDLFEDRQKLDGLSEKTAYVEAFYQYFLGTRTRGAAPRVFTDSLGRLIALPEDAGLEERIDILISLYETASDLAGEYERAAAPALLRNDTSRERIAHAERPETGGHQEARSPGDEAPRSAGTRAA